MAVFTALAVIGAAAAVVGTVASVKAQKKANRAQASMAREQQKQQELVFRREQRAAIREAQIRRAQGLATVQGAGISGGSLASGGSTSLGSQAGSAIGFGTQMSGLSQNITNLGISAANYTQKANTFGALAQIGGNVFQFAGGPEMVRERFG